MTDLLGAPRPLRILQLCAVDFTIRQFLLPLGEALRREGHEVVFSSAPGPYTDEVRARGFDVWNNPVSRSLNVVSHAVAIWRTSRRLRRERFDIVHVHTPIAALVGRIAAWICRVPIKVYTAHGFYFHDEMPPGKRRLFVGLEKLGAYCGDFIMTVSREDEAAATALRIVRPDEVETIYNGVDITHFDPSRFSREETARVRAQLGIAADAPVIGIVGRLVREKGFFELLEAMRQIVQRYPAARLLIVGDVLPSDRDGAKGEFLERADAMGLSHHLAMSGLVKDTAPYLAAMDIFALPSYREGMPVSLLEAMAMELPAVATDIRGCREEVVEGETGWLVPARQSAALADRLESLLAAPDTARTMGRRARERVLQHFDIVKVVDHQLEIYRRLIAKAHEQGRLH